MLSEKQRKQHRMNWLLKYDLRGSFSEQSEAGSVWRMSYDGRHWFANWIKRVDFVEFVLGARGTDALIVLSKLKYKAE